MPWLITLLLLAQSTLCTAVEYRHATINDSLDIARVFVNCYNIQSLEEGQIAAEEEMLKGYRFVLAIDEGEVVGIASWVRQGLPKHRLCELSRIAVVDKARGKGVAGQLFQELEKSACDEYARVYHEPLRKMYILTHANNDRAHTFYKKMGCMHETTLKNHYYDDLDEFVFAKYYESE